VAGKAIYNTIATTITRVDVALIESIRDPRERSRRVPIYTALLV
jgi:hypothetical protein